jgi:hypothetical protein
MVWKLKFVYKCVLYPFIKYDLSIEICALELYQLDPFSYNLYTS